MGNKPKSILKKRAAPADLVADYEKATASSAASTSAVRPEQAEEPMADEEGSDEEESDEMDSDLENDSFGDVTDSEEDDDEEMIRQLQEGEARPAKKLKHTTLRPTAAPAFSNALTHLLSLPATSSTLQPKNAPPSAATQRLERRAKDLIRQTKAEHYERGHVRDVIAGWSARPALPFSQWENASARQFAKARAGAQEDGLLDETGAEREKRLRKLAQRGVVRLFNAIGAAQGAPAKVEEEKKRIAAGTQSEAGAQQALGPGESMGPGGKVTRRPNVLGARGKGETLTNLSKASFLDLIRAGTTSAPLVTSR